jgi:hypothetical protein
LALFVPTRAETAEMENRVVARINGTYVRTTECSARRETTKKEIESLKNGACKSTERIDQ